MTGVLDSDSRNTRSLGVTINSPSSARSSLSSELELDEGWVSGLHCKFEA